MNTSKPNKTDTPKRHGKRRLVILAGAIVIILVGWYAMSGGGSHLANDIPTGLAIRGEMLVSITASGEIKAEKKKIIANNLPYAIVIVERVDEGTHVNTGELIIRFECKQLLDDIDRTNLDVTSTENSHQRAREDIELTRKEWRNNVAQAESTLENSKNNLRKFKEHEQAQQMRQAIGELENSRQELTLGEDKLAFMEKVNTTKDLEGTYSASTIEAEHLRVKQLTLKRDNCEAEVKKLEDYEHPRELRRLELSVAGAELDLERSEYQAKVQVRLSIDKETSESRKLEMTRRKLVELQDYIKQLEWRAESPGIIVYDSVRHCRPPDLSVGARVESRRRLMRIPDMSTLRVFSKVFEGVSEKVSVGMAATVRFDSRPGEVYSGEIAKIAELASSQNRWANPNVKVFPIEIVLDETPKGIKPGSTAEVELVLARLTDALIVPIASVFTRQEESYCWTVSPDGQPTRAVVTIGEVSDTQVQILSGLTDGDVVLLAEPSEAKKNGNDGNGNGVPRTRNKKKAVQPPLELTNGDNGNGETTNAATRPARQNRKPKKAGDKRQRPAGGDSSRGPARGRRGQ